MVSLRRADAYGIGEDAGSAVGTIFKFPVYIAPSLAAVE
jgi:hypothetical protein